MYKIVFMRHGESNWNLANRFTGWVDVDLTEKGVAEASQAGSLLKEAGFTFDLAYTSVLKRAIRTLWTALDAMDLMYVPVQHDWRLNERHYGALQGLNKAETAARYGDGQVLLWRRSYDTPPDSADRVPQGHCRPRAAGLERRHCAGHPRRQEDHRRGARQQPARADQVSGRHQRQRHRRPQHSQWPAAGV